MESAILFMVVLLSFSILLTTVVLGAHTRVKASEKLMQNRIEIEQIGEYFVSDTEESGQFEDSVQNGGYTATVTDGGNILTLKSKNGTPVLYIEKNSAGKVLVWRYNLNQ